MQLFKRELLGIFLIHSKFLAIIVDNFHVLKQIGKLINSYFGVMISFIANIKNSEYCFFSPQVLLTSLHTGSTVVNCCRQSFHRYR